MWLGVLAWESGRASVLESHGVNLTVFVRSGFSPKELKKVERNRGEWKDHSPLFIQMSTEILGDKDFLCVSPGKLL